MGAAEFVDRLLVEGLGARHVVVGHDFHFARRREGTDRDAARGRRAARLRGRGGRRSSCVDGERVSSSLVREALERGDLDAGAAAARPSVPDGRARAAAASSSAASSAIPTANLALHRKVVPLWGIFAVRVSGAGLVDHPAVVSLGTRPTINGTDPLLEVHAVRLRRRPLRPATSTWTSCSGCATSRSSSRSTRWSRRCTRCGQARAALGSSRASAPVLSGENRAFSVKMSGSLPPTRLITTRLPRWPTTSTPSTCPRPPSR